MNSKIIRRTVASLAVVSLIAMSGIAFAGHDRGHGGPGGWGKGGCGYATTLTEDQQVAAKKVFTDHKAATSELRLKMKSKRAELKSLMYTTTPDVAKIEAVSKEIGDIGTKLTVARAQFNADMVKAGVPADFLMQHKGRGFGRGMGHGPGFGGKGCPGMGPHGGLTPPAAE